MAELPTSLMDIARGTIHFTHSSTLDHVRAAQIKRVWFGNKH
jgi:hypothetical protein